MHTIQKAPSLLSSTSDHCNAKSLVSLLPFSFPYLTYRLTNRVRLTMLTCTIGPVTSVLATPIWYTSLGGPDNRRL